MLVALPGRLETQLILYSKSVGFVGKYLENGETEPVLFEDRDAIFSPINPFWALVKNNDKSCNVNPGLINTYGSINWGVPFI